MQNCKDYGQLVKSEAADSRAGFPNESPSKVLPFPCHETASRKLQINQRQSWTRALVAFACVLQGRNTWLMKHMAHASVSLATTSLNNNENHLLQNKARKRKEGLTVGWK